MVRPARRYAFAEIRDNRQQNKIAEAIPAKGI